MRSTVVIYDAKYRRITVQPELSPDNVGSSLEQALSDLLRERTARGGATLDLPVFDGGVFLPGIDPLDTSALLDIV